MRRAVLAAFMALLLSSAPALADKFPSHPVTIIVPFSAGGPSDAMMRILSDRMQRALGETLIIENVTGAGGSLGVGRVVRSAPDGCRPKRRSIAARHDRAGRPLPSKLRV